MKVVQETSKLLKPIYQGVPPFTTLILPLSVFDKAIYDAHMPILYGYRAPTPPNSLLELGLRKLLSEYRVLAGRLDMNNDGQRVIRLNDEGIRFIEAFVDCTLDEAMPFDPSLILSFYPCLDGMEELAQAQLTRFTCGSLVVGFSSNHITSDANAVSQFLVSWGRVCRGLEIDPRPIHDRSIFHPRDPPMIEFEHLGVEFKNKKPNRMDSVGSKSILGPSLGDVLVAHKVHFAIDFIAQLKAKASLNCDIKRPYSTFQSLVAHMWRATTRARELNDSDMTYVKISVGGRARLNPPVPNEYFGNVVLWAYPEAQVKELLEAPLSHAAKLVKEAVAKVNDAYFKSFIDFANNKVAEDDLVPTTDMSDSVTSSYIEVDSWLNFPFNELDFGGGKPSIFMPCFIPILGQLYLVPSLTEDGAIDAYVTLFQRHMAFFQQICYSLD